ncbi:MULTISPECIES: glycoside hydrolase family 5 protein [unclassified Bacteroides]|jgi:endoglucanase|uniref:glycoside hydrolase family 5 protein n=1 Tax=unclassified Bacteroides TaxID=2646097 RepID=UPI000E8AF62C|nr:MULTISPECIES: glycoside hydrolase family 5 protein [unclassified Bacteroides]RGN51220.1 glycoside hydrolase family 5 protein [Bacteroides sp. OM05-12]RHR78667.1 glycoside hydrolase family 5 protein [Bacteroides sp. AF16-49]
MFKNLLSLSLIISLLFFACSKSEEPDSGGNSGNKPEKKIVYFGVNLSGAEFGGIYPGIDGTHYGYPTEKDLDYFKAKGLYLIRFPFRWERIQPAMNGELNTTELEKMKLFVKAAEERNMQILLDMHNFGRYCIYCDGKDSKNNQYAIIGNSRCTIENLCDVWIKLAKEFKDYKNIWGYDIMNEPNAMLKTTPWFNIAQACIDAIRTVDTKTTIVVSGDEFSSAKRWKEVSDNLKDLIDPSNNLIFQAHVYFDHDTSGNYAKDYDEDGANIQTGVARLRPFVEWLQENNKRGFVGEYGVPDKDGRWLDILDAALKYLQDNGVNGTYWSAGPRWGDYPLAIQPTENYTKDRPQMEILLKYKSVWQ